MWTRMFILIAEGTVGPAVAVVGLVVTAVAGIVEEVICVFRECKDRR